MAWGRYDGIPPCSSSCRTLLLSSSSCETEHWAQPSALCWRPGSRTRCQGQGTARRPVPTLVVRFIRRFSALFLLIEIDRFSSQARDNDNKPGILNQTVLTMLLVRSELHAAGGVISRAARRGGAIRQAVELGRQPRRLRSGCAGQCVCPWRGRDAARVYDDRAEVWQLLLGWLLR